MAVFIEAKWKRGIPCACLEAADRWEALNLTEQTEAEQRIELESSGFIPDAA